MARQLAGAPARSVSDQPLDLLGHLAVEARSPRGPEVLVDRVLDESMAERVAPGRIRDLAYQGGGVRLLEELHQCVLFDLGDRRGEV